MAFDELNDLLSKLSPDDRAATEAILGRNPQAASELTRRETVFNAFTTGDLDKLNTQTAPVTPATPAAPTTPAADLGALDTRLNDFRANIFKSPEFQSAVDTVAEAKARALIDATIPQIIGRGAELSDTISSLRENHLSEFKKPLDSEKFKEFFGKNGASYGNDLRRAYDAYVGEERMASREAAAFARGQAEAANKQIPGTALPESDSVAGHMLKYNMERTGNKVEQGPDANAAAQAFDAMRRSWTN